MKYKIRLITLIKNYFYNNNNNYNKKPNNKE